MHLQSPRTLESVAMMHMSLIYNSFGSTASSDSDRSVKTGPIGKASNANALISRDLCSHNLTIKAFDSLTQPFRSFRQSCHPVSSIELSSCPSCPRNLVSANHLDEPSKQSVGSSPVRCRSER